MTDKDGEIVQHYGYQPYGAERYRDNTSAFSVSNRYTGQTLDAETGLYYYGARYYDPEIARFIQADTTVPDPEFSQAYNRYAYVYNNPLKFTDPTGQFPWAVAAAIMKAMSYFNAMKAVCVAIHTGNYQGLALGLTASFIGAQIGGAIGGAIQGTAEGVGAALGGAIGAAALNVAVSGGNAARAIGEAVVWAYVGHYCKMKAEANDGSGEKSIGEQHAQEQQKSVGDPGTSTPVLSLSVFPDEEYGPMDAYGGMKTPVDPGEPTVTYNPNAHWIESGGEISAESMHYLLDAAGLLDPTPICDGIHAVWYFAGGEWHNGGLAAVSMIPYAGDALGKGGKYTLKGVRALRKTENVAAAARSVDQYLDDAARFIGDGYDEIAPGVFRSSDNMRQVRFTNSDLIGHGNSPIGPHGHLELVNPTTGKVEKNIHIPLKKE